MYEEYYGLTRRPFENTSNPEFFFASKQHREALAALVYGINESKGFMLLTGDVGAGKTFVLQSLKYELEDQNHIILEVATPWITPEELFAELPGKLGMDMDPNWGSLVFQARLKEHLEALHKQGRRVLVLLDEAQQLPERTLEGIRLLSNFENEDAKLVQIIFVGQNELNNLLSRYSMRQIRQRITLSRSLGTLSETETQRYIQHRLSVSGAKADIFTQESMLSIYQASHGSPRLINLICDNCLITGYAQKSRMISPQIVSEVVADLPIFGEGDEAPPKLTEAEAIAASPEPEPQDSGADVVPGDEVTAEREYTDSAYEDERKGFGLSWVLLLVFIVAPLAIGGYWFWQEEQVRQTVNLPVATKPQLSEPRQQAAGTPANVGTQSSYGVEANDPYQQPLAQGQQYDAASDDPWNSAAEMTPAGENYQYTSDSATSFIASTGSSDKSEGAVPGVSIIDATGLVKTTLPSYVANNTELSSTVFFPFEGADELLENGIRVQRGENLSTMARARYGTWNDTVQDIVRGLNPELRDRLDLLRREDSVNLPAIARKDLLVAGSDGYAYAYAGTLTSRIKADNFLQVLEGHGVPAGLVTTHTKKRNLYRVFIGPYETQQDVVAVLANMQLRHMPFLQ